MIIKKQYKKMYSRLDEARYKSRVSNICKGIECKECFLNNKINACEVSELYLRIDKIMCELNTKYSARYNSELEDELDKMDPIPV